MAMPGQSAQGRVSKKTPANFFTSKPFGLLAVLSASLLLPLLLLQAHIIKQVSRRIYFISMGSTIKNKHLYTLCNYYALNIEEEIYWKAHAVCMIRNHIARSQIKKSHVGDGSFLF